jgi:rSAM/selenodomain-associated transferase 1
VVGADRAAAWYKGVVTPHTVERRTIAPVAVAIMAKAPVPGQVKTRLCPPLAPAEAAELARCFLLDRLALVSRLDGAAAVLAHAPADAGRAFEALDPGIARLPQRGAGLSERLTAVFGDLLGAGHAAVIAVDTDSPTLPREHLQRAVDALRTAGPDVVIGPSADGGYCLIGARAVHSTLFDGIPWSTPAVLAATLSRARAAGLRVECLPEGFDVDTPADLDRLRATLRPGGDARAPRTTAWLLGRGAAP